MKSFAGLTTFILVLAAACAPTRQDGTKIPTMTLAPETLPTITSVGTLVPTSTPPPTSTLLPVPSDVRETLAQFPLYTGSTWVYSSIQYDPMPADPRNIITATYLITVSIARIEMDPPYLAVQVMHDKSLIAADPRWTDTGSSPPHYEYWYAIQSHQIFIADKPKPGSNEITPLSLEYDLPFAEGKSWCPVPPLPVNPACMSMGRRTVESKIAYTTPLGKFDDCYVITQDVNSGGTTQWFCNGIGIVAEKYDHAGTRFGSQDTLVSFSRGSP